MLLDFPRAIDCTLTGLTKTFCFLDDILIVSRGGIEQYLDLFRKCLINLDQENLRNNLTKCHFAKDKIEWLGYSINQTGITPVSNTTDAIEKLSSPSNLKNLRSLWDQFIILANLLLICRNCLIHLDRYLRKKQNLWQKNKTDDNEEQLKLLKEKIAKTTEKKHFNLDLETRIKCDASRNGLGCALVQQTPNNWHTVAVASRFLNSVEERFDQWTRTIGCFLVYWTIQVLFIWQAIHCNNWS